MSLPFIQFSLVWMRTSTLTPFEGNSRYLRMSSVLQSYFKLKTIVTLSPFTYDLMVVQLIFSTKYNVYSFVLISSIS